MGDWPARLWAHVPGACDVQTVEHVLPVLDEGVPSLRLAFISDLHVGPTTPSEVLDRAFELVQRARPDVLLLGGDFVFLGATPDRVSELERRVSEVVAPTKLAVLGNHDLWTHHGLIEAALARAGVRVLINETKVLNAPHDHVAIVGIDEPWTGNPDVRRALAGASRARVKIALAHAPEAAPMLQGMDVSLLVCGHTHGGQIAASGGRPFYVPGVVGRSHPWGFGTVAGVPVLVSRGIGGVEIPVRLNAQPDILLVTLSSPV